MNKFILYLCIIIFSSCLSCSDMINDINGNNALFLLYLNVNPQRYLYVTDPVGGTVSMFSIDRESGCLTPLSPATVPSGTWPNGIGLHPGGDYLYTTGSNSVWVV